MKRATLKRENIIKALMQAISFSRQEAVDFMESTFELMVTSLVEQGQVKITSFGSFKGIQKPKRLGRNPKTGKDALITARRVLSFKPSGFLRQKVRHKKTDVKK